MARFRPSVEIVTPTIPERRNELRACIKAVQRQTYALDFGGTILHTIIHDGGGVWPAEDENVQGLRHIAIPGPHDDHGTAAIQYGMSQLVGDLAMQLSDDEHLEDMAIKKLVDALLDSYADFAMCWRDWPQRPGVMVTGNPPEKWNLTTGLFKPKWWKVADMVGGPSGLYTQPGADGMLAYDWLRRGAELVIVPEVLSHVGKPVEAILGPSEQPEVSMPIITHFCD